MPLPKIAAETLATKIAQTVRENGTYLRFIEEKAPADVISGTRFSLTLQYEEIGKLFKQLAKDYKPNELARSLSLELRKTFKAEPEIKRIWDNEHVRATASQLMGQEMHTIVENVATGRDVALIANTGKVIIGSKMAHAAEESDPAHGVAQKIATALTNHEAQLKATEVSPHLGQAASKKLVEGTRGQIATDYHRAKAAFTAAAIPVVHPSEDYEVKLPERVVGELKKIFEANPAHKETWAKPQVQELAKQHLGKDVTALVNTAASDVKAAGAAAQKASSKMSGKAKWVVGGLGAAAVGLGAVMYMGRGKSFAQGEGNRRNNPLNEALARG